LEARKHNVGRTLQSDRYLRDRKNQARLNSPDWRAQTSVGLESPAYVGRPICHIVSLMASFDVLLAWLVSVVGVATGAAYVPQALRI
jgi:hypothetical protein